MKILSSIASGSSIQRMPRFGLVVCAAGLIWSGLCAIYAADDPNPSRIIQYRGAMPLLGREFLGKEVQLKFELYRSPDGGSPFWKESRTVSVREDGWVNVDLGEVKPLPDEAFTTPFRFLSIWQGDFEFGPRKQVVSLVYVASVVEAQISSEESVNYTGGLLGAAESAAKGPDRDSRLDELVDCGSVSMERRPRSARNWLKAVEIAKELEARLPTFQEWYGAYDGKPAKELLGMVGHYEWVVPWVYEPSIHVRLHELYRGKTVACYYNELSPMNDYPFRLVVAGSSGTDIHSDQKVQ